MFLCLFVYLRTTRLESIHRNSSAREHKVSIKDRTTKRPSLPRSEVNPMEPKLAIEKEESVKRDKKQSARSGLPPRSGGGGGSGSSATVSKKPPVQRRPVALVAQHSFIISEDDGEIPEKETAEEREQNMLRSLRVSRSLSIGSSDDGEDDDVVENQTSIATPDDVTESRQQASTAQRYDVHD